MLKKEEIDYIQDSNNVKVLLCSIETDFLYNHLWSKVESHNYYIISLNQDHKVSHIILNNDTMISYSFEIWFCVSSWSQNPTIPSFRALPFMSDMIFYKDKLFFNAVKELIHKYHQFNYIHCGRPTHLRKEFSLDKCKGYLSKILLNYWFREGNLRAPENIAELLMIDTIPNDLLYCVNIALSGTKLKQEDTSIITETIIKYHTMTNELCTFGDVVIPEAEYVQLRNKLYMENNFRPL